MATTTKLDKKELKKPDEFVSLGSRATEYVAENPATTIGGTLLVLVAIAAFFGWLHQQEVREIDAAGRLYEAEKLLEAGGSQIFGMSLPGQTSDEDKKKAIELLDAVAAEFPGTDTARRAKLKAGDVHLELGEFDPAIAVYEQALSGAGAEGTYYARNGIAHAHEGKQAWDLAAAEYRKIVDDPYIPMADIASLDLARVLVAAGKTEEARTVLSKFAETYPNSSLKDAASDRLATLGGAAVETAPATGTTSSSSSLAPAPAP